MNKKYYQNDFGNVFGNEYVTPYARAQYVALAEPNPKFKPPKYSVHLLFSKNDPSIQEELKQMKSSAADLVQQKYPNPDKLPTFKYPALRDGDAVKGIGFAGNWFIKASCKNRPPIFDGKLRDVEPDKILPGVVVRATVRPILFDDGIAWQLVGVQLVRDDGTRYFGGGDPKQLMGTIDGDESPETEPEVEEAPAKPTSKKVGKEQAVDML